MEIPQWPTEVNMNIMALLAHASGFPGKDHTFAQAARGLCPHSATTHDIESYQPSYQSSPCSTKQYGLSLGPWNIKDVPAIKIVSPVWQVLQFHIERMKLRQNGISRTRPDILHHLANG